MKDEQPDIILLRDERVPESLADEFVTIIGVEGLNVKTHSRHPVAWASLELLVPTAVVVLICKPYFEGFLQEAGKEHYQALKKGVAFLGRSILGQFRRIGPQGAEVGHSRYSFDLSLVAPGHGEQRFKLLIQNSMVEADLKLVVGLFLEFVEAYWARSLSTCMTEQLSNVTHAGSNTVLLAYDFEARELVVIDPLPAKVRCRLKP